MKKSKKIAARASWVSLTAVFSTILTGCNLAPVYVQPPSAVPAQVAPGVETAAVGAADAALAQGGERVQADIEAALNDTTAQPWLQDARLRQVVALALAHNRDLRVAIENVEKTRAQYAVARADLLPSLNAQLDGRRSRSSADASGGSSQVGEQVSASLGFTSYELDLWGRVRNLKTAAWQQFLQVEENRRSVLISLMAEVANAWLTVAADQERLALAHSTLATREQALQLQNSMFKLGAISGLTLVQSQSSTEAARGDVAQYTAQLARSQHALQLLVGAPLAPALLPPAQLLQQAAPVLQPLAQNLPSSLLLQRPDVLAAEHQLQAQHAQIGAARAAFFPSISLTASSGSTSSDLDGLFTGPNRTWSFAPQVKLPIFSGGRLRANLQVAQANQRIALAQYEKAVQTAFKEVADVLADLQQWDARLDAQNAVVHSTEKALQLSQARMDAGADDYLTVLDAQRSLYSAQHSLIALRLSQRQSHITLWKVLGGQAQP